MAEQSITPSEPLWEVLEEHLDEADWCFAERERQLGHPLLTLDALASGIERRLFAHVDALVVSGGAVVERLLKPQIAEATEANIALVSAATLALLAGPSPRTIADGLFHEEPSVRKAAQRACLLARSPALDAWTLACWHATQEPQFKATLMPMIGARLDASVLLECLQSDDPELRAATTSVVARGYQRSFGPVVAHLMGDDVPEVRDAALIAALAWGLPNAWRQCERVALDPERDHALFTALYAALGSAPQHESLLPLLDNPVRRESALAALGYSGDPKQVPRLIELTAAANPREAKLAAQSISLITGIDLDDSAYALKRAPERVPGQREPAQAQPPPAEADDEEPPAFEDDDLDAELVPSMVEALNTPSPPAIAKFWLRNAGRFAPDQRYLRGKPFGLDALFAFLSSAAMGTRSVMGLCLGIRSAGQAWLDTGAFSGDQQARLAELRGLGLTSFSRSYGAR